MLCSHVVGILRLQLWSPFTLLSWQPLLLIPVTEFFFGCSFFSSQLYALGTLCCFSLLPGHGWSGHGKDSVARAVQLSQLSSCQGRWRSGYCFRHCDSRQNWTDFQSFASSQYDVHSSRVTQDARDQLSTWTPCSIIYLPLYSLWSSHALLLIKPTLKSSGKCRLGCEGNILHLIQTLDSGEPVGGGTWEHFTA